MVIPILVWHGLIMLRISLNSFGEDAMKRQYLSIIISLIMLTLISCEGGSEGKKNSSAAPTELAFWAKTYGGTGQDYAYSIQQTSDGGYIVAGMGDTFDFDKDLWVLKLNSDGTVAWQKAYRGDDISASFIQQTSDGGYIVLGVIFNDATRKKYFLVLKLNSDGTVAWQQKAYGETGYEYANSIQQTSDGGYIMAGIGIDFDRIDSDFLVLKLNSDGRIAWQKTYGGTKSDSASSIQQTSDEGYIVVGGSNVANEDVLVLKLNSDGTVVWQKTYGGTKSDSASSIQQTSDEGYIVVGNTYSFGTGSGDFWILKLNSYGTVAWQKTYGGTSYDYASSIQQTSDEGYIVVGNTYSFGTGSGDFWILKLNSDGTVAWQKTYGGTSYDFANSIHQTSDGGYIVAGYTYSFGAGFCDFWVLKLLSDGTINFNSNSGASTTDTSATVSETSVTGADINITVTDTSITTTDIMLRVVDIYTTINQQAP